MASKVRRCRQGLEAVLPQHVGTPLFNTIGNSNSYQTVLAMAGYETFSTYIIQRAITAMAGTTPLKRRLELDPNGGIHPRTTASVVSSTDTYDDSNLRYGVKAATSRIIHEVDFGLLPAHQAGHATVSDAKVAVAAKLCKISKVLHKMDDVPALINTIKTAQAGVTDILEVLEDSDVDTDTWLTSLGISQDEVQALLGLASDNDEVSV